MKNASMTKRLFSLVLALLMVFSMMPRIALGAKAASTRTIYLNAGGSSLWDQSGAWFAAWVWGSSEPDAWYTFTATSDDGIYKVDIPAASTGLKINRMASGATAPSWTQGDSGFWNQIGDLTLSDDQNLVTVTGWSNTSYKWGTYTPPAAPVVHTWTVAGTAGLCGTDWDTNNTANDMTKQSDNTYVKVYNDVAAGTYEFKVVCDHDWGVAYPGANYQLVVEKSGSKVTITFDASSKTVNATVEAPECKHEWDAETGTCAICEEPCPAANTHDATTCPVCGYADAVEEEDCAHLIHDTEGICVDCGEEVSHEWDEEGECSVCGIPCPHENLSEPDFICDDVICVDCDNVFIAGEHSWVDGVCEHCSEACEHADMEDSNETCPECGLANPNYKAPVQDDPNTYTIYFQNNWNWSDVRIYFWGSATVEMPAYPGIAMEKFGNDGIYDIYTYDVPADITGMIITGVKDDGSGNRDQSSDVTGPWYDGVCYYMHWDNGNVIKECPISDVLPDVPVGPGSTPNPNPTPDPEPNPDAFIVYFDPNGVEYDALVYGVSNCAHDECRNGGGTPLIWDEALGLWKTEDLTPKLNCECTPDQLTFEVIDDRLVPVKLVSEPLEKGKVYVGPAPNPNAFIVYFDPNGVEYDLPAYDLVDCVHDDWGGPNTFIWDDQENLWVSRDLSEHLNCDCVRTIQIFDSYVDLNLLVTDTLEKGKVYVGPAPAVREINTCEELIAACKDGGEYKLGNDLTLTESVYVYADTVLDLNGKKILLTVNSEVFDWGEIAVGNPPMNCPACTLTLRNGTVEYADMGCLTVNSGTLNLENGNFERVSVFAWGNEPAVLNITGSTVSKLDVEEYQGTAKVNKDAGSTITEMAVTAGTFNFDPSAHLYAGYTAAETNGLWKVSFTGVEETGETYRIYFHNWYHTVWNGVEYDEPYFLTEDGESVTDICLELDDFDLVLPMTQCTDDAKVWYVDVDTAYKNAEADFSSETYGGSTDNLKLTDKENQIYLPDEMIWEDYVPSTPTEPASVKITLDLSAIKGTEAYNAFEYYEFRQLQLAPDGATMFSPYEGGDFENDCWTVEIPGQYVNAAEFRFTWADENGNMQYYTCINPEDRFEYIRLTGDMTLYAVSESEGYVLLSTTEPAPADYVLQVGDEKFEASQLKDAFTAANNGGTIEVLKDFTLSEYIQVAYVNDVTLNLNGFTITLADVLFIANSTVTINAENGGMAVTDINNYLYIGDGASVVLNGGTYGAIHVNGTAELHGTHMEAGSFIGGSTGKFYEGASLGQNAWTYYSANGVFGGAATFVLEENCEWVAVGTNHVLTKKAVPVVMIGDTTYETLSAAINAAQSGDVIKLINDIITVETEDMLMLPEGAMLDLNGKKLDMRNTVIGCVSINGGSLGVLVNPEFFFELLGPNAMSIITTDAIMIFKLSDESEVIGGTMTFRAQLNGAIKVSGTAKVIIDMEEWDPESCTLTLSSTTASIEGPEGMTVTTDLADHKVVYADGVYTAVAKTYVAYIGEQGYETLLEAVEAAGEEDVIVLKTDISEPLSNETLTGNITTDNPNGVTVTDSTNDNYVNLDGVSIGKGITLDTKYIYVKGDNVLEGTLKTSTTLYLCGNLQVQNGGAIEAYTILHRFMQAGEGLSIYGDGKVDTVEMTATNYFGLYSGTFYAKDAELNISYLLQKQSNDESRGYGIATLELDNTTVNICHDRMAQRYYQLDGKVGVKLTNGSKIKNIYELKVEADTELTLNVDETSSIHALVVTIAEGLPFEKVANGDNTYGICEKVYPIMIGETGYETLEAAMAAAETGDTIMIMSTYALTEATTINLPGVTIATAEGAYLVLEGDLTIEDAIFNASWGYNSNEDATMIIKGGTFNTGLYLIGSVSINGGIFNSSVIAVGGCTDITITGGTFNNMLIFGSVDTTISGGTFNGSLAGTYAVCSISGGTFKNKLANGYETCIAAGYDQVQNEDGTWSVVVDNNVAKIGNVKYATLEEALDVAQPGNMITLLNDTTVETLALFNYVLLDLNGHTLEVQKYVTVFAGNHIMDIKGGGLLKCYRVMIDDGNAALPIYDSANGGYVFVTMKGYNAMDEYPTENSTKYIFLPYLNKSAYDLLARGSYSTGVSLKVEVTWEKEDGKLASVIFTYTDDLMAQFAEKYETDDSKAFTLTLTGTAGKELSYRVFFESSTGVMLNCY